MPSPLLGTQGTATSNYSIYLVRTWSLPQIQNSTRELIGSQDTKASRGHPGPACVGVESDRTETEANEANPSVCPVPLEPLGDTSLKMLEFSPCLHLVFSQG